MFYRTIAAATAVLALGLAGCSDYTTVEPRTTETTTTPSPTYSQDPLEGALQPQKLYERHHVLEDGRDVTCLSTETALSCNWPGVLTQAVPAEVAPAPVEAPRG